MSFSKQILLTIILSFLFPATGISEKSDKEKSEKPPRSVSAPINDSSVGQRYISSGNIKDFQDNLLAPLAQLISEKKLILRVADKLGYEWNYSREWVAASEANINRFELDPQGWIRATEGQPLAFGFPFSEGLIQMTVLDPALRAQMIIWNSHSLGSIGGTMLLRGAYLGVGVDGLMRRSNFSLLRNFDTKVDYSNEKDAVYFRELFSFYAPSVIRGFSISTTRYQSGSQDLVQILSPVLKQPRHVAEVNREDLLLDGNLSVNDLFMFSGNPRAFDWKLADRKKMYVPYISDAKLLAEEKVLNEQILSDIKPFKPIEPGGPISAKCVKGIYPKSQGGSDGFVNWRFESTGSDAKARGVFAPWSPLTPVFVLRDVWVVEAFPRDPFYQYGKQVMFIDTQSYLPFYRLVYDRRGIYQRLLMASWAIASDSSTKNQVPVVGFILAIEKSKKSAAIFETNEMCFALRGKLFTKTGAFDFEMEKAKKQADPNQVSDAENKDETSPSEDAGRD